MIDVVVIFFSLVAPAAPQAFSHGEKLEHRGTAYEVTYHPRVSATAKTVGARVGARTSQQRCRWTLSVEVDRQIRQPGGSGSLTRRLVGERRFSGDRNGSCEQNRRAIELARAEHAVAIAEHVRAFAAADRPALLSEIDAARSLALN